MRFQWTMGLKPLQCIQMVCNTLRCIFKDVGNVVGDMAPHFFEFLSYLLSDSETAFSKMMVIS